MSVLNEIVMELATITPEDVAKAGKGLPAVAEGEEVLGTAPERSQFLWALVHKYRRNQELTMHTAKFDTSSVEEAKPLVATAQRLKHLGDIAGKLAWAEAYDHFGGKGWLTSNVAARTGYVVVVEKEEEPEVEMLGGMPITEGMVTAVKSAIKRMVEAREKEGSSLVQEALKKKGEIQ